MTDYCDECTDRELGYGDGAYCHECLACAYMEGEITQAYDDHVHCDQVYELDPPVRYYLGVGWHDDGEEE